MPQPQSRYLQEIFGALDLSGPIVDLTYSAVDRRLALEASDQSKAYQSNTASSNRPASRSLH
jgi:hypothetical protein